MNDAPDTAMTCTAPSQAQPAADGHSGRNALTVMFDGSCPLCQREIGLYRSLAPLQPVVWVDVSQADLTPSARAGLMARFHVQESNGQLLSGAAAFVALWLNMPGWHWLGRFGRLPGVTPLMELVYRAFLTIRPAFQRMLKKRFSS